MHFQTEAIKNKNNEKHFFPDLIRSKSRKVLFNEKEQWLDLRLPRLPHALRKVSLFSKKPCVHQQREWSLWKQQPKKRNLPKRTSKLLTSGRRIEAKWLRVFHFHWLDSPRLSQLWINIWFILQFDSSFVSVLFYFVFWGF